MSLKSTPDTWSGMIKFMHWLIVLLILGQGGLALWMGGLPNSPTKVEVYALHKSIGLTILALVALRLLWRLYAGAPQPVPGMPRWQAVSASLMHALLYVLLFAIPISGWVMNSAAGFPLQWFGLFNLPALVAENQDLRELAGEVHEWLFWLLVALAAAHAAAALYHHLFRNDDVLRRMLPGYRR